ncbi:MAG: hypothetical protein IT563_17820 [Alphaproteobacteria bacterium]|nr:hypothetical protein [Alphaproteobacteria bacterium]
MAELNPDDDPSPAEKAEAHKDGFRTKLAIVMVLTAVLGAFAAFRTAVVEQETKALMQRLAQGQLFEIIERHRLLNETILSAILGQRAAQYERLGKARMKGVEALRATDPGSARLIDLQAQEEFLAARAIRPFYDFVGDYSDSNRNLDQSLRRWIAPTLARHGFEVRWDDPLKSAKNAPGESHGSVNSTSLWSRLDTKIHIGHQRVLLFASAVVCFVFALVVFTLTDLMREERRKQASCWAGIAAAIVAAGCVGYLERDTWWGLFWVGGVAGLGVLACVFWFTRARAPAPEGEGHKFEPAHVESRTFPGVHLPQRHVDGRFSRALILGIAITVLLSALVGLGYSDAESAGQSAMKAAAEHEVDMSVRSARWGTLSASVINDLSIAMEGRARRAAIQQRLDDLGSDAPSMVVQADREKLKSLDQYLPERMRGVIESGVDNVIVGIEGDPEFPNRIIYEVFSKYTSNNMWEPFALWDAALGDSLAMHHKTTIFLFTLTVFAVAVYLFGQGLGMGRGWPAFTLAMFGVLFVAVGIASGVYAQVWPGRAEEANTTEKQIQTCRVTAVDAGIAKKEEVEQLSPRQLAALSYARAHVLGQVVHASARSAKDPYPELVNLLYCATALRPDFVASLSELAIARGRQGSNEVVDTYFSLVQPPALPVVVGAQSRALRTMRQKGFEESASLLSSAAFDRTAYALERHHAGNLDEGQALLDGSIEMLERALRGIDLAGDALTSSVPLVRANLGLALLAKGNIERGHAMYMAALKGEPPMPPKLRASVATDLELLLATRHSSEADDKVKALADEVRRLKEQFIGASEAAPQGPAPAMTVGGVHVSVTPGSVLFDARLPGFDSKRDRISVAWYGHDEAWNTWYTLQGVTGPVTANDTLVSVGDSISLYRSYSARVGSCLGPGRYRAELYVNGRLVDIADKDREFTLVYPAEIDRFIPTNFHNLNLRVCRPPGWLRWQDLELSGAPKRGDEMINGLFARVQGGLRPAVILYSFLTPRGNEAESKRQSAGLLARARAGLVKRGWINDAYDTTAFESMDACTRAIKPAALVHRAWTTAEGLVHIAVAVGGSAPGDVLCQVIDSVETIYTPFNPS